MRPLHGDKFIKNSKKCRNVSIFIAAFPLFLFFKYILYNSICINDFCWLYGFDGGCFVVFGGILEVKLVKI